MFLVGFKYPAFFSGCILFPCCIIVSDLPRGKRPVAYYFSSTNIHIKIIGPAWIWPHIKSRSQLSAGVRPQLLFVGHRWSQWSQPLPQLATEISGPQLSAWLEYGRGILVHLIGEVSAVLAMEDRNHNIFLWITLQVAFFPSSHFFLFSSSVLNHR